MSLGGCFILFILMYVLGIALMYVLDAPEREKHRMLQEGDKFPFQMMLGDQLVTYEMIVDRRTSVQLPRGGKCDVHGLTRNQACKEILKREIERDRRDKEMRAAAASSSPQRVPVRQHWQEFQAFPMLEPLPIVMTTPQTSDGWKKLHDKIRVGTIQFARQGNVIRAIIQGHPSGMVQIDWETLTSSSTPYLIVVRKGGLQIASERAYCGRVVRALKPGLNYIFSFEVYELDEGGQKWRDCENNFSFVVTIPTAAQWNWNPPDEQNGAQGMRKRIEKAVENRHAIERAIDDLHLDTDEAHRVKAAEIARQVRELEGE